MDIDHSGQYLVTTSTDSIVRFYTCLDGKSRKSIHCRNYGASCVKFTHHSKAVLEACPKDNCIRYHSLHDNAYIRTFSGHEDRITMIEMQRIEDIFFTCGLDKSIRLWDLRQPQGIALLKVEGRPTIACDHEGLIFAAGTGNNQLKLYDMRQYEHGPFHTFLNFPTEPKKNNANLSPQNNNNNNMPQSSPIAPQTYEWCSLEFSPDGKHILISTRTNLLILVDSFQGIVEHTYENYENKSNIELYATFSPDGQFIACGSTTGDINFWNTTDGQFVCLWKGHPKPVPYFKFNPQYLMSISAAQHVAFWLPSPNANKNLKSKLKSNLKNQLMLILITIITITTIIVIMAIITI